VELNNPYAEQDAGDWSIVVLPRMGGWSVQYTSTRTRRRRDRFFTVWTEAQEFAGNLFDRQNRRGIRRSAKIDLI
jgi:ribonuclease PH